MTNSDSSSSYFETMRREHQELAETLAYLSESITQDSRTKIEAEKPLVELAEHIAVHFRHEENGGYLHEALVRSPNLAVRAETLLNQHELLLEQMEMLRILVHSGVESPAWWTRVIADLKKLSNSLLQHMVDEDDLVREAFAEDATTDD